MSSDAPTFERMRHVIENVDLELVVIRAKKYFGLIDEQIPRALEEYRHFMFLLWQNSEHRKEMPVVPTKRADAIWHAHLLDNGHYNRFCEAVHGRIVYHNDDDYQEGSASLLAAVACTRKLHAMYGECGFVAMYLDTNIGGTREPGSAGSVGYGGESPSGSAAIEGVSTSSGSSCASCAGGWAGGEVLSNNGDSRSTSVGRLFF